MAVHKEPEKLPDKKPRRKRIDFLGDDEKRMTFTEHLAELRTRLIRVIVSIVVAFVLCFVFREQLFYLVSHPLEDAGIRWMTLKPMESFWVYMKLSGYGSVVVSAPLILYEICAFVFPGLKRNEKRIVLTLLTGCTILSVVGVMTAYFLVTPQLIQFMKSETPEFVEQALQMSETVSFIVMLLIAFGAAFQFPMIVLILVALGLISPAMLKQYRRIMYVLLAVASAVLTPTADPITFSIMWIPLVAMYEGCVWISVLIVRKKGPADTNPRPPTKGSGGGASGEQSKLPTRVEVDASPKD